MEDGMIECVTLETNHLFQGNPIAAQHKLRHRLIIQRQNWEIPQIRDMEYDAYDNPATTYLVWRGDGKIVQGVSRLYPADRPFMLKEHFAHTVTYGDVPSGSHVWEGSRFCIDNCLDGVARQRIAREIVLSYLEYGLDMGITQIIGIMYPVYWNNLFAKNGWDPIWLGDTVVTTDGKKSRAAALPVSKEVLKNVRNTTGIQNSVIQYGNKIDAHHVQAA
jgi:N-acyl-L-homoserine lactone synthetase